MKQTIDDLPLLKVSALVASGQIDRNSKTATIRFTDDGAEYVVGVVIHSMPSGGFWAKLRCPKCGGNSQRLRLLDDMPACGKCVRASGLIYRSQATATAERHRVTAPKRRNDLEASGGFRVHRPTRKVEGRARVEAALKRSLMVPLELGIAEYERKARRL